MEFLNFLIGALIFFTVAYVFYFKVKNDRWPKVRSPYSDGEFQNPFY